MQGKTAGPRFLGILVLIGVVAIFAFSGGLLSGVDEPTKFQFTSPKPDTEFKTADPITATGTHRLKTDDHVWMFLLDIYGGYYLQNPPVELLKDGKWEATNIRPRKGIRAIVAVYVDAQGHESVRKWVEAGRWGKILLSELKELHGYEELARLPIITPATK